MLVVTVAKEKSEGMGQLRLSQSDRNSTDPRCEMIYEANIIVYNDWIKEAHTDVVKKCINPQCVQWSPEN